MSSDTPKSATNPTDLPCTCTMINPGSCPACVVRLFKGSPAPSGGPTRLLTYFGTRGDFLRYLENFPAHHHPSGVPDPFVALDAFEVYQWELTASIGRHPAGKGLGHHRECGRSVSGITCGCGAGPERAGHGGSHRGY